MPCSPARLAANRLNALKSTGPRTPDGKAASRLNAFRHGMAGGGDLLAPDDDVQLVADRASAFVDELGADDEAGQIFARRAALLSARMERSSIREMTAVAALVAEARARFDRERLDEVDRWIKTLEEGKGGEVRAAIEALEASPEGVSHLLGIWTGILEAIQSAGPHQSSLAVARASSLLGLSAEVMLAEVAARVAAEVERLLPLANPSGPLSEAVAVARAEAGIFAGFDPSPEATLARRYEAAAERGMYRALRAIAEVRRARGHNSPSTPVDAAPNQSSARPVVTPTITPEPLGSFRAGVFASSTPATKPLADFLEPLILTEPSKKKRPDLRKFAARRR